MFEFEIEATDVATGARSGRFHTPHGIVKTPVFAPVGTQATVKALRPDDLVALGADLILANTYHLYLRPGDELIRDFDGLHGFMQWDGPILTDSGGFQVFSLSDTNKVDDEGVTFKSHHDGSMHRFTPESSIAIQENLGADVIMAFDECPPPTDYEYVKRSLVRTHSWVDRCLAAKTRSDQALFGIVQGGVFRDLREESARYLMDRPFPGFAIGGLAVGETKGEMHQVLDWMQPVLPVGKPRYLMGVGMPEDLVNGVMRGIDIFDCVLPTRLARHNTAFTLGGKLNLRNAKFKRDGGPLVTDCQCYSCGKFSRAYIHHLVRANEILGHILLTLHNVHFLINLMGEMREAIGTGRFQQFAQDYLSHYPVPPPPQNHGHS